MNTLLIFKLNSIYVVVLVLCINKNNIKNKFG